MWIDTGPLGDTKAPGLDELHAKLNAEGLPRTEQFEALSEHQRLFEETALRLAREEALLIEGALAAWAEQCGVSVPEWGKFYGYRTEREFFDSHVRIAVHPVLRDEPPESWPAKGVVLPEYSTPVLGK
jgi:hypothetical protein